MESNCGTQNYKAPEIFDNDAVYDEKVDVFALAVILYELYKGKLPDVQALRDGKDIIGLDSTHPDLFRTLFE